MTIWKPGMFALCVVDAPSHWAAVQFAASYPKKGEVVTVRAVNVWPASIKLRFEEHWNEQLRREGDIEPGFSASWFRPLSETRLDIFRQHLAPVDRERADA